MAKESKAARAADEKERLDRAPTDVGGGINPGVAIIGFILCFLAGAAVMWGWDKKHGVQIGADTSGDTTASNGANWSDNDASVPIDSKDPMWGNRNAPVTIVQFSDYQCPFCSRVEPTMDQVKSTYGPDKVRIIWKNLPLPMHPNAKPAAEAAQGVFAMKGSEAFWKFHDTAFKNQSALNADSYKKWAKEAGVTDMAGYEAGLNSHKWADKVDKDAAIAKQVGASGTPAFFVNGVFVNGAQPFDKFKTVIDEQLQKAQAKIAAGTPKDKVYVTMTNENKAPSKAGAAEAKKDDDDDDEKEDKTVWKVPVGNSPVLGKPDALVTIIEFSDFQCPYCSRVEPTLKSIRDKYGDQVRIVWKHEPLPFHPRAEPCAEVALEARAEKQDKGFWEAHDRLFEAQKDQQTDEVLWKLAGDMGLNVDKVKTAMSTHKYKKDIDADQEVADDFQASGTPHFFVNGRRLVGAQPLEKFTKVIDEELAKAKALVAKGTPAAGVYEATIKDGKGVPEPEKKAVKDIPPNDPWKGNEKAKVVIHEWSDFQCPFCGRVEDTVKEVMKNYGDKVKFVWHDLPLPMHPDAPLAAQAAREVYKQKGNDGFWKIHDKMFSDQKSIKRENLDADAKELGIDMGKWAAALDNGTHKAEVDADAKAGNDAGISGTPAFVINGYFISGAQPYTKFRKLIERALAEAK